MKTLISCTYHSDKDRFAHNAKNKINWSKRIYEKDYLTKYRFPQIAKQLSKDSYVNLIYVSGTRNEIKNPDVEPDTIVIQGSRHEFAKHHDSFAGMTVAAQYAYANNMDYCYIEHDCLVKGLSKAFEFGKDKMICYGFGEFSYLPGWAEQSFVFVPYFWIPEFLRRLNQARINQSPIIPELTWHKTFYDVFTAWPFGYGRKLVHDWNEEIYYKQQLTDNELDKFLELGQFPRRR